MKKMALVLLVLVPGIAFAGQLDGKSFCRTVVSDGMFGQPKGKRQVCISFAGGIATDSSNTFFGNPPQSAPYKLSGSKVTFSNSQYELSSDQTQLTSVNGSASAGVVFKLQLSDMDLIKSLDSYYADNTSYQNCVAQLNGGKPISVPVSYKNRLTAASFAEGLIAECK